MWLLQTPRGRHGTMYLTTTPTESRGSRHLVSFVTPVFQCPRQESLLRPHCARDTLLVFATLFNNVSTRLFLRQRCAPGGGGGGGGGGATICVCVPYLFFCCVRPPWCPRFDQPRGARRRVHAPPHRLGCRHAPFASFDLWGGIRVSNFGF